MAPPERRTWRGFLGVATLGGLLLTGLTGCFGSTEVSPNGSADDSDDIDEIIGPVRCGEATYAGPAPVRRLTSAEYNNTVRDLLGDTTAPAREFGQDGKAGFFDNNLNTPMTRDMAEQYLNAATGIATRAVANADALLGCAAATASDACIKSFITRFGRRAYRRPLEAAETDRLLAFYQGARIKGDSVPASVSLLLQAMLTSPHFLMHIERGDTGKLAEGRKAMALTPHELASRLSYFAWGTMPDDALFAAAESGKLSTPEGLEAEARRLFNDPRAKPAVLSFFDQWLELPKVSKLVRSAELFPEFNEAMKTSLVKETETFIDEVVLKGDGKLSTLLTADFTYGDANIAQLYGIDGVTSTTPVKLTLDKTRRSGLLTQPSLMALTAHSEQTSPVHRGKFVRVQLLCDPPAAPPPGVDVSPPAPEPGLSTRERFQVHQSVAYCAGCHMSMDPIGLGFEHYDGLGRWRDVDAAKPVDASGEVVGNSDVTGKFHGAVELGQKLASSAQVQACLSSTLLSYAVARPLAKEDACSQEAFAQSFKQSGGDIREALVSLVKTDAFRLRRIIPAESCQ